MAKIKDQDALDYHFNGRPGKIEVVPTKPYSTQRDLSLAYSPGVAVPCLAIEKNVEDVYKYTAKGNLVAVISNGTAVLGLGDIGAEAGKPVMEGKGLLFKIFADVDVFDIEISTKDIDIFVETVKQISPTFGGINLEDIKAPECFEIERRLVEELNIPVMHDDQHGTAIISSAGILNALELSNKKLEDVVIVVNGAGASAVACTKLLITLGAKLENVIMLDTKGVLHESRTDLNESKRYFATKRNVHTLEEAMSGADVFFGLSKGNIVTKKMVQSMAPNCIVFAMANPDPEITYEDAMAARKDIIMATGRSDYPNQVNNVLGFPFIFRGALDVRAKRINEEMKIAAVKALASLAKEDVPESVNMAYNVTNLTFGRNYILPKPLDTRLISTIAPAVAKAAMDSGVAQKPIKDWDQYKDELSKRLGLDNKLQREIMQKAKQQMMNIVFAEANNFKMLKAAQEVLHEGIARPILVGDKGAMLEIAQSAGLDLSEMQIVDIHSQEESERRKRYADIFWKKRQRKGLTQNTAYELMYNSNHFGIMMVETGEADAFISGIASRYGDTIAPALRIVGKKDGIDKIAGMYVIMTKKGPFFFADTTVTLQHTAESLAQTALLTASEVRKFNIEPVIAMLSYSNFGSVADTETAVMVREAVKILHKKYPDLIVDGEMQANSALNADLRERIFPFSKLHGKEVNTLIFPDLNSGNIAYKLMQEIGGAEVIGPILMGLKKPIHVVPIDCSVREIVNMASLAAVDAQLSAKRK
ncbi:MAG: NADP-dependent malic enzyme [Saprospiraceae bacterium]|jgi:malate dehydrogenase (oxaloacetate-decarboxylating)(NADP+)|nr:NADP-dependent malic enzyme [Saprospiraceae bacterium]